MNDRIDIRDFNSQITKRVGPDKAQRYFSYLNRLLSQKLSKHDFDKLCVSTLGRENIPLHNKLIRAILKNACQAKSPPPKVVQKNAFSNGDMLLPSAKRSRLDNLKIRDYFPSPLRPHGRAGEFSAPHNEVTVRENGDLGSKLAGKAPIQAPLGIPFCLPTVGGARRPLNSTASAVFDKFITGFESGELCHSEDLRRRMEKIAESQGLEGVMMDCANLLNKGLDAYLKRLIGSCSELVGARSGPGQIKKTVFKPINGVWQGNHRHVHSGGVSLVGVHEMTNYRPISLKDFRVAVELDPQKLGEDWPLLLEKVCLRSFEE